MRRVSLLCGIAALFAIVTVAPQAQGAGPYKVIKAADVGGAGRFDYVYADVVGRRLYIPRTQAGPRITVFDLDTLAPTGEIPNTSARGAAVDPASGHGFVSSKPVVMFDTKTLAVLKSIDVQGGPDGILFDAFNGRVHIFSHSAPNDTVINAVDGTVVGTIDLGGAPEQAQSDGKGKIFVDIEDKKQIAVIDAATMKVIATYDLGPKGGEPAGLGFDVKNHVLFAACASPSVMVILNSDNGNILTTLPVGDGTDGGGFNPNTMEAFSSNRDGTLTVVKENSPTNFVVAQNVQTKAGAKTMTIDTKTNQILLITNGPGFQILVVGR
jgi:hypothetical protein